MDWIKKNWIWIAIGLIVIAVIVGIIRKNKADNTLVIKLPKFPRVPGMAGRGSVPSPESIAKAKDELAKCEESTKSIRLMAGAPHPCASIRDVVKGMESSFFMQNGYESNYGGLDRITPFAKTEAGLNTVAFGIGDPGTSLLKDGNLGTPTETN